MNKSLTARIKDLLQRRQLKGTLTKIALTLSCMSIFLITYMLVAPVLTQEWEVVCGMEEHVHTDECYTLVPAELAGTGHKHTDECYTLVPAEPDEGTETSEPTEPGHQHTDACYAPAETGHQHTDACYEEVPAVPGHHHTSECYREVPAEPGHQHTDACYEEIPEVTGHQHSDGCYTEERGDLNCGQDEHSHSDGCYDEEGNLTCGMSEHSHDDSCYGTDRVLSCGQEESEGRPAERKLICGQEESEGREAGLELICGQEESEGREAERKLICGMTESVDGEPAMVLICGQEETDGQGGSQGEDGEPEMVRKLTCGLKETEGQDESQGEDGEAEMVRVLTCGLEEHVHTDQCYHKAEESAFEYICGFLTEHTHNEDCYFESGELKCTLEEHTHDESCLPRQKPERAEGPIFPAEPPDGYKEAEVFDAAGMMMFAMSGDEDGNSQAGIQAAVYIPENAFSEEVVFVPQPLFEGNDAYDTAVATLENAGEIYESMPAAMDLSFMNENGDSLEPDTGSGSVYVRLEIPESLLVDAQQLEDEDAEVTLWHHIEDDVEAVEKFYFDYTDGMLTVEFVTDSFSTYTITTAAATPAEGIVPITWGTTDPEVKPVVGTENGSTTWDVSGTPYRFLKIPVRIDIVNAKMTVRLPKTLTSVGRTDNDHPTCDTDGIRGVEGSDITIDDENNQISLTIDAIQSRKTIDVYYTFDCWNVKSEEEFSIECVVVDGQSAGKTYTLKGKIITGHGVEITEYYKSPDTAAESEYSLPALGGVDKRSAFITHWDDAYAKYFSLTKEEFDSTKDSYVYDIAPFLIKPTGQQPYNISGTFTPDQKGELINAVYMMDTKTDINKDFDALWVSPEINSKTDAAGNNQYSFTVSNDDLKLKGQGNRAAVVSGNLADTTDSNAYTLYFLVKYPKDSVNVTNVDGKYEGYKGDWDLNASLTLTHTGIDSGKVSDSVNAEVNLYSGPVEPTQRIYWAAYVADRVQSNSGLTSLKNNKTATIEYSADFFCLNEARTDRTDGSKYELEAIIDLSYLTNNGLRQQLGEGDYRFSGFKLSLVDAKGNWSDNGDGRPTINWNSEAYSAPEWAAKEMIRVYGSTSLNGENWEPISEVPASSVWAINTNRDFPTSEYSLMNGEYVRLKVVYDSRLTTGLRVGYQMELKPEILEKYELKNAEELTLTNWFNYFGYKGTSASPETSDKEGMKFQKYPTDDSSTGGFSDDGNGTASLVRKYDNKIKHNGYNVSENVWDYGYSLRNFAKATVKGDNEVAGMLVTQALYDSEGKLVGDPTSIDPNRNDSYSLKKEVTNVSEIVYSITGAVTNGASGLDDLKARIDSAPEGSPYKSLKMRYYVLLPDGLKLNTNPDNGETDENGAPKYHFWTEGTTEYLSANSAFYNGNSDKVVQGGQTDIPTSDASISTWKRVSANGSLSEMYWVAGGSVTHNTEKSKGNLIVFERDLGNWADWDRFNMWGTSETYVWGRGLSFSVVPENGVTSLPADDYQVQFWCQYLDSEGKPISMSEFDRSDDKESVLEGVAGDVGQADTLLYVPITFTNKTYEGNSKSKLEIDIDNAPKTGYVSAKGTYSYPLTYDSGEESSDVVLWCNVEMYAQGGSPLESPPTPWHGIVTGVDVSDYSGTEVYVRTTTFDHGTYATGAKKEMLTVDDGWEKVDLSTYTDWASVKAIAFSFEGKVFKAGEWATVQIEMKAPEDDGLYFVYDDETKLLKDVNKTDYTVYNRAIVTNKHDGEERSWPLNTVQVSTETAPPSYQLPSTGGKGTTTMYTTGLMLLIAAAGLMYQTKRRGRRTRKGGAT